MEYPHPIDVVYTWVNGSDEELIKKLNFHKANMYLDMVENQDREIKSSKCSLDNCAFIGHLLATVVTDMSHGPPSIQLCLQRIQDYLTSVSRNNHPVSCSSLRFIPKHTNSRKEGYLLECSREITSIFDNQTNIQIEFDQFTRIKIAPVHITARSDKTEGIPMNNSVMLVGFAEIRDSGTEKRWIGQIEAKFSANVSVLKVSPTSFLITASKINDAKLTPEVICSTYNLTTLQPRGLECHSALYLPDHLLATVLHDISGSRYHDNDELKYSLRSLDKYLQDYRYIFIVTNGQVPVWLNVNHPRIKMIFHTDIFANSSHLPTFNSAAIEANLHNIPGLSPHFLYLNDDVFFGKPTIVNDFYNLELGYTVYLGWEVPNCVENCPNAWLGDSYCDQDCNVPECGWDAGDCRNKGGINKEKNHELFPPNTNETDNWVAQYIGHHNMNSLDNQGGDNKRDLADLICKSGCNKKWLADQYCDAVCNVVECGFDLGDCGDIGIKQKGDRMDDNDVVIRKLDLNKSKNSTDTEPIEIPRDSKLLGVELFYTGSKESFNVASVELTDTLDIYATSYAVKYRMLLVLWSGLSKTINRNISDVKFHVKWSSNHSDLKYTNKYTIRISDSLKTKLQSKKHKIQVPVTSKPAAVSLHLPNSNYSTPGHLSIDKHQINSVDFNNSIIEQLEWQQPIEMSRYRLLLKDGLLTKRGYFQLVLQLLKGNQSKRKKLKVTKQTADVHDGKLENLDWGFLPWERLVNRDTSHGMGSQVTRESARFSNSRKLMDLYSESLRFSNLVISKLFQYKQRKVPAHGPHFISKSILMDAHDRFQNYWQDTSGHRFRNPSDIQFSFTYFHYLMTENKTISIQETLQAFDTDNSGFLNLNELRSLLVSMNVNETISDKQYSDTVSAIKHNCTNDTRSELKVEFEIKIKDLVSNCFNWTEINWGVDILDQSKSRYRHHVIEDPDFEFIMISTKREKVLKKLDTLRKIQKKFFCLNDNLPNEYNSTLESIIRQDVRQFLQYHYPFPSQFEKKISSNKQLPSKLHHYFSSSIFLFLFITVVIRLLCHVVHVYNLRLNKRIIWWFSKQRQRCKTAQLDA